MVYLPLPIKVDPLAPQYNDSSNNEYPRMIWLKSVNTRLQQNTTTRWLSAYFLGVLHIQLTDLHGQFNGWWWVGWLLACLLGWLILVGWLTVWLVGWLTVWLVGWLVGVRVNPTYKTEKSLDFHGNLETCIQCVYVFRATKLMVSCRCYCYEN